MVSNQDLQDAMSNLESALQRAKDEIAVLKAGSGGTGGGTGPTDSDLQALRDRLQQDTQDILAAVGAAPGDGSQPPSPVTDGGSTGTPPPSVTPTGSGASTGGVTVTPQSPQPNQPSNPIQQPPTITPQPGINQSPVSPQAPIVTPPAQGATTGVPLG